MEAIISRLSPNVVFRVIAGGARLGALYLATHAAGTLVGWQITTDAKPLEAPDVDVDDDIDEDDDPKPGKTYEYADRQPDLRETKLTRYNVFCPTCAPVEETLEQTPGIVGPAADNAEFPDAIRTQLPLALVATMEAEDPGISLATISYADGGTGVFAEGEFVLDDVTLLSVDLGLVYLRTATRVEFLPLSSGELPPSKPTASPKKDDEPKSTKPNKYAIDGAADSIKCNGNSCTVERRFVNQLLANPAALATQAAARPYDKQGLQGFQLSRVRKGTIPRLLGFRSSDVIKSINGQELSSIDGAMKLYARMRNASHLSIDFVRGRKGKRYEKRLEIDII